MGMMLELKFGLGFLFWDLNLSLNKEVNVIFFVWYIVYGKLLLVGIFLLLVI